MDERTRSMFSQKEVRKSCMLVLGRIEACPSKRNIKRVSLLGSNPGTHAHTLVLGPSLECLWRRHIVWRFWNIGFDQAISQQHFSLLFAPPTRPLESWKESYIPGFGVLIEGKELTLDCNVNMSWLFLGFDLSTPRLRVFLKSRFSWWKTKTRCVWRLYSLLSVFKVYGDSLMLMMWGAR